MKRRNYPETLRVASVAALCLLLNPLQAQTTQTLTASRDAYVRAGSNASSNYGTATQLVVKNEGDTSDNTRESWLGFDLSGVSGTVTSATLRVYITQVNASSTHSVHYGDDGWSESGLTWNNQPTSYSPALDSASLSSGVEDYWVEYDVTSRVATEVANSSSLATFVLVAGDNAYTVYDSRETSNEPELVITTTTATPSSSTLYPTDDTFVRAGANANTNYGTNTDLEVKAEGSTSDNTRESWLQFDVGSLSGTVTEAKLRVYLAQSNGNTVHTVSSASDSWTESTLTWNNRPSVSLALDTASLSDSDDGVWVEYDVTSYIASEVAASNSEASFRLAGNNNVYTKYRSREHANRPELVVTLNGSGGGDPDPDTGLDPDAPPSENFDLSTWKITLPDASERQESWVNAGNESPGEFFTDPGSGGMVFRCPNIAGSTSGSNYSRTELREMLRAGNTSISTHGINGNNWVFSTSTTSNQNAAGGVDGTLTATLRVDHVSTTGDSGKVGRVIVGQIHASDAEPCRLYYRKLPGNSKGSIYFAHEPNIGSTQWYEMIGSRSNSASNPSDGIELGEVFSYTIDVVGNTLTVTISREGKPDVVETMNMSGSGFANDWMYFKAGVYNQNNSGSTSDYAQATFFALSNTHD
ncbi:MAG: polysaccharide lyase family 7 protein [Verrucomicrobiota bacterium JB022]|nr:polysaccharide lyase family 7 protein [Verrucomicrobiota bacterium JB022]